MHQHVAAVLHTHARVRTLTYHTRHTNETAVRTHTHIIHTGHMTQRGCWKAFSSPLSPGLLSFSSPLSFFLSLCCAVSLCLTCASSSRTTGQCPLRQASKRALMPRLPVTCRSAPSDKSRRAVDSSPWKHAHCMHITEGGRAQGVRAAQGGRRQNGRTGGGGSH
jgi:hypothetical protein